mgnify:CR=1 FL=1
MIIDYCSTIISSRITIKTTISDYGRRKIVAHVKSLLALSFIANALKIKNTVNLVLVLIA